MKEETLPDKPEQLHQTSVSRRSFLKWSSIIAGGSLVAGVTGCTLEQAPKADGPSGASAGEGEWIPAQCWSDCGSRGFNKVYVVDGKPRRMGTDETVEDTPNCPRVRSCARGRASRAHIFSADRLKYPMKRKHWEPGGGNRELRGRDEWERITWDEALDYVAGEIKRITETYGNEAILVPGFVASLFGQWDIGRTMALYGGYMDNWGACSSGAWGSIAPYTGLLEDANDRFDIRGTDLVVLWGSNLAWSRAGLPTYYYLQAKNNGAKFISIDIFRNATAEALADEWVPVRPGTDVALAMAMAYVLLTEDEARNKELIDWDFLDRCTIGFDADHLPQGADPQDNFKDYVLGTFDGLPKTPAWAAEICGVPEDIIEKVALEIAETEKVVIYMSPAPSRTTNGHTLPQAILALGAMAGCIGKPGCMTGSDAGHTWLMEGKTLAFGGNIQGDPTWFTPGGKDMIENPIGGISPSRFTNTPNGMYTRPLPPFTRINVNEIWTSVLEGTYKAGKDDDRECPIQMYYHTHSNLMNQTPGTMKAIEAHRKVEFVVTQNIVMTTTAKYSDIVLPITTQWERKGDLTQGYREQILYTRQVTEPLFEAKDDIWVAEQLAERLGIDPKEVTPFPHEQEMFNQLSAATVIKENGTDYEPLLTITKDDIKEMGVEGEPQEGRITYQQFMKDGIYQVPRHEGDNYGHVCHADFRKDPEKNPLNTVSGKFEIHSQALAEDLLACGWTKEVSPIPKYVPAIEGYEETFSDWENKVKGEYPLQLVSVHSLRFAHSTFGNVPILREAFDHPLWMNPLDAESLGLKHGDTVLAASKWGKVLRPLCVSDWMTPGVCALAQGAWVDIDEETGIDKAGCTNVLNGPNAVAFGHQAWNSCLIKVEKWTGEALLPDAQWAPRETFEEE
ncbi:MAG: molybdopterin-dependent oxidoreductase [Eggerthellaceae bacterium]|nr:molybdopterin-dependent oxidoreductase [Eggerthellaceae bacterium]